MNWQTQNLFDEAKKIVSDETVFSPEQIALLVKMIDKIDHAVDKESDCIKSRSQSLYG